MPNGDSSDYKIGLGNSKRHPFPTAPSPHLPTIYWPNAKLGNPQKHAYTTNAVAFSIFLM